jgi:hypothetical protein
MREIYEERERQYTVSPDFTQEFLLLLDYYGMWKDILSVSPGPVEIRKEEK